MSSSEDQPGGSAASPTLLSTTPVSAAAAATIAATTITPESLGGDSTIIHRLSVPSSPTPSQQLGVPTTPLSEQPPSSLLLLSPYVPPSTTSTTSLSSDLKQQQHHHQAQYLRAAPPPRVPSPAPSSIRSIGNRSMVSRASTAGRSQQQQQQGMRQVGAVLWNDASARRMRVNVLDELSTGWVHLSTSSRLLIIYYTVATLIELIVTTTILVLEQAHLRSCIYLVVFLVLYLIRAVTINFFLLRKFLWTRPDNLPIDFSGAVGAQTLINWASLVLVLFSIAILTTQSECSSVSPPLFFLVLTFSLLGYMCAGALLLIWIGILFCMHGFVALLELFHVGPTAMRWQGAQEDLISKVPLVRFKSSPTCASQPPPPSSLPPSKLEPHRLPSTFTVTITKPASENSSRRPSIECTQAPCTPPLSPTTSLPPATTVPSSSLDTIQESKLETPSEAPDSSLVRKQEDEGPLPESTEKTAIVLDMPKESDQQHPGQVISAVIQMPEMGSEQDREKQELPPQEEQQEKEQVHSSSHPPPVAGGGGDNIGEVAGVTAGGGGPTSLEPMATMTIEGQGIFVDGYLVQEGNEEMISSRCSICLCEYEDAEELRHMPCNHFFHRECLDEWLKLKRTCPLCKYDIQDMTRFSKRLSWKRHHRRRSSAAASTSSSRNGRSSLHLWRRSQS